MKNRILRTTNTLSRIGLGAVAILAVFAMLFLSVGSMLGTADMSTDNPMKELIIFGSDSLLRNLVCLVLTVLLGAVVILFLRSFRIAEKTPAWVMAAVLGIWITVLGILWVVMSLTIPTQDSYIVTAAGVAAANGDLSFTDVVYFVRFPFQLGYVLWTEFWARLFSLTHEDYIAIEIINVVCLAFGEAALVLSTDRLFRNKEVTLATAILLGLFFQPVIFSTFLYGTIPGFCFAAWAIFFFIKYLETDRWRFMIPTALALTLSVTLKLNNMILLVAMGIILLAHLMKDKPLRRTAALAMLCATVLILPGLPQKLYENRLDKEFGDGIPMISWMAMGLHDAPSAPGWYNGRYTVTNFQNHGNDQSAAAEASKKVIEERLEYFKENPDDARVFFKEKILSQWNEPTYQSIWNNQVRTQVGEKWGIAAYICGDGEDTATRFMDLSVQLIFFGMLISTVLLLVSQIRKNPARRPEEAALFLIPLLFLGGFLYHALFEGKSQYVIAYVTFMIPYAVWGLSVMVKWGKTKFAKLASHRK